MSNLYPNECTICGKPVENHTICIGCIESIPKLNKKSKIITAPKNNISENKAKISLIPLDLLIPLLEPAYREGILKYQRESWRIGFQSSVMYDALMRHLTKWFFELESLDPEAKDSHNINKHHLGAAIFCLINLYNTEHNFPELDDRPLKFLGEYKNGIK